MTNLSEADTFQKCIFFREFFNRLGQITWSIRTTEQRFPMGTPESEKSLLQQYEALYTKFKQLAAEGGDL